MAERRFQLINKRYRDGETLCFGADADFCIDFDGTDVNFTAGSGVTDLNITGMNLRVVNNVGFYNTAPVAKPTGVAVSAAGIHAALVTLGLIT